MEKKKKSTKIQVQNRAYVGIGLPHGVIDVIIDDVKIHGAYEMLNGDPSFVSEIDISDSSYNDVYDNIIQLLVDLVRKGKGSWEEEITLLGLYGIDTESRGSTNISNTLSQFDEGISPLSHDNSIERAIRKHMTPRSKQHMRGSDRYRRSSPAKRVLAKLKRASRHQPKPEVDEAFSFYATNNGKTIKEEDFKNIADKALLYESIDTLMAMSMNGWQKCDNGVSNGMITIVDDRFSCANDLLLYNNKSMNLNFDWLYSVRELLRNSVAKESIDYFNGM
jgi:hypothetical protein